jgi:hypothetical protein
MMASLPLLKFLYSMVAGVPSLLLLLILNFHAVANTGDGSFAGQHRNDGMFCLCELQEGFAGCSIGKIPATATHHLVCSPAGHFPYICFRLLTCSTTGIMRASLACLKVCSHPPPGLLTCWPLPVHLLQVVDCSTTGIMPASRACLKVCSSRSRCARFQCLPVFL